MLTLFTDGSCVKGNPGMAGGAYVLMQDGAVLESLGFPLGPGTNNEGELEAAARGLEAALPYLSEGGEVLLVADSLYMLQGLAKCDRMADGMRPNHGLWARLKGLLEDCARRRCRVLTYWVHGHAGNPGNALCDRLANSAATSQCFYKEAGWKGSTRTRC